MCSYILKFTSYKLKPIDPAFIDQYIRPAQTFLNTNTDSTNNSIDSLKGLVKTILLSIKSQEASRMGLRAKVNNQRCTNHCSGPHTPYHKWFAPFCDNHDDCYKCVSRNEVVQAYIDGVGLKIPKRYRFLVTFAVFFYFRMIVFLLERIRPN